MDEFVCNSSERLLPLFVPGTNFLCVAAFMFTCKSGNGFYSASKPHETSLLEVKLRIN